MPGKKRLDKALSQVMRDTTCKECGKHFERRSGDWGYVRETNSAVHAYYCSYRCMMADERRRFDVLKAKAALNLQGGYIA